MTPHRPVEWLVGVDIGQTTDPTAIAVLQRVALAKRRKDADGVLQYVTQDVWRGDSQIRKFEYVDHFHLRALDRLKLGTPYAAIAERTGEIIQKLPPYSAIAVVDQTGVGRPVVETMQHLPIVPVTIVYSESATADYDGWKVGKKILVSNAQVLLQNGRLRVAKKIRIVKDFVAEMMSFRVRRAATSTNATYETHREGVHDDLVLATCLAAWWGTQRQTGWLETPPYPDLDEDGLPHPKAGQPQEIHERMLDSGLIAARKRFARE